ncbi:hypothetical protein ACOID3_29825, partial [Klebsiella pneumoniae]
MPAVFSPPLDLEELEDLEDTPEVEASGKEEAVLDQATAARTIEELRLEIGTLKRLEALAQSVRQSGEDRKWQELANLLEELFTPAVNAGRSRREASFPGTPSKPLASPHQKLVIFTEHRDTLHYLVERISTFLGRPKAVVWIHGIMSREERAKA